MIRLYDVAASGNCYRVRLLMALAGIPYEVQPMAVRNGGIESQPLLRYNSLGEVPVVLDGENALRDSAAILVYLAGRYAPDWFPPTAVSQARIVQWLSLAVNEIQHGIRMARAIRLGIVPGDYAGARAEAERTLNHLQGQLAQRRWLECERPTIADVACYPYVWNAAEADIDLEIYPAVLRWTRQLEALPGYEPMIRADGATSDR